MLPVSPRFPCHTPSCAASQDSPSLAQQDREHRALTLSLLFKGALKSQRISEQEMQPLAAADRDRG